MHLSGYECRCKQFHAKFSLISAPQWHHTSHSEPLWINKAMMPVKTDPSYANGVTCIVFSRVWPLCLVLDFMISSCAIMSGFHKLNPVTYFISVQI